MVKKAIIPVAGLASRFLPASKVIPKTMFPIVDKPIIQFLVEEAVSAGIEEIAVILSPRQDVVRRHFEKDPYLEEELEKKHKTNALKKVQDPRNIANITFFTQEEPLGDGHALLQAKEFLGEKEACLVVFGDEIIGNHTHNATQQLVDFYNKVKTPIIGVQEVPEENISRYGIVDIKEKVDNGAIIQGLIEKPTKEEAPSNQAIVGKYIINKEILHSIEQSTSGTVDKELRLIDGFKTYLKEHQIHSLTLDGTRFDTGNQLGLLQANLYFGLQDKEISQDLKKFIQSVEK